MQSTKPTMRFIITLTTALCITSSAVAITDSLEKDGDTHRSGTDPVCASPPDDTTSNPSSMGAAKLQTQELCLTWLTNIPLYPTDCSRLDDIDPRTGLRLHVCGKWWDDDVVEQLWQWLPQRLPDNNTASGWGSWTGLHKDRQGYLYLKWHKPCSIQDYDSCGQPTASGGLPD